MPPLTLPRARRWSVALPLLAGGLAFLNELWMNLGLPVWVLSLAEYETASPWLFNGVLFAVYVGLALRLTGGVRDRKLAATLTLVWGLAFGAWFVWATVVFAHVLFGHDPATLAVLGGRRYWAEHGTTALVTVGAGGATAALVGWTFRSPWIAGGVAGVTFFSAALFLTTSPDDWTWSVPAIAWHAGVGALLGRFVLNEALRRLSGGLCPGCGYPLAGLPDGGRCPECGGAG